MRFSDWLLLAALATTACTVRVDPDKSRFSCDADADCGSDYECRSPFGGGKGRCFARGSCQEVELCNGADDNCDGRVDESFPEKGTACTVPSLAGRCNAGSPTCSAGVVTCTQTVLPGTEKCDGVDEDCDGTIDNGFDLTRNDAHCGTCDTKCGVGTACRASRCEERTCSDALDNDDGGTRDCADPSCAGLGCNAGQPNQNCAKPPDAGVTDGGLGACVPREAACANGADDDNDGQADCADTDCNGQNCAAGHVCAAGICPSPG